MDVYHRNATGLKERMLFNTTQTIFQHFKAVRAAIFAGMTLFSCLPIYDIFFRRILTKLSPMMFPYLDDQVLQGYLISCVLNIVWAGWSYIGIYGVSCMFLLYVHVYDALVSLVEDDLNAFDATWETKCVDIKRRKFAFKNIMLKFMDIARYSVYMNERFNFITTIQMGSTYLSFTTVLFGIIKADFISGIGASVYYVTQILTFSFIGQIMQDTTDRIGDIICNTNWYKYDVSYQQDLILLLSIMQNVSCVRIADIYPLNFERGLAILKSIYSIFMFLVEVA
ncbi:odorant receptor 67d-like [Bradysia coprophila]|uniref:odorant receptor 67d-like n=1 Tax=Bradysia coprophila TaxID=38358 RepID=UPI00187D7A83|nr:odorant receptor 67d-like [Bradysia coprophila]